MAHVERVICPKEIDILKESFIKALFSPPGESSPFGGSAEDLPLEPSLIVAGEDERLKKLAGEMFAFIGEVTGSNSEAVTPKIYQDTNEEEGTTFCRAVLGLKKDWRLPKKFQLWITEKGLIETEDPVRRAERIDGRIKGEMERLFSGFIKASETNVPKAAEKREETLRRIVELATQPVEVTGITLQSFRMEDGRPTYAPLLGLRLIHCVAGYQAYPVIFAGGRDVVCYGMPLLEKTATLKIDRRLGEKAILGLVDEETFNDSSFRGMVKAVCDKAFKGPLCVRR